MSNEKQVDRRALITSGAEKQIRERFERLLEGVQNVQTSVKYGVQTVALYYTMPTVNVSDQVGFHHVRAGTIAFCQDVFGTKHSLYEQAVATESQCNLKSVNQLHGILLAVQDQIESGFLKKVQTLVAADIFEDLLAQAEHLLSLGYRQPAASLTGAVLEDGLRKIAMVHGVAFKERDGINSLNIALQKDTIYNKIEGARVNSWREVRNAADHGRFNDFDDVQTRDIITGTRDFLAKYL